MLINDSHLRINSCREMRAVCLFVVFYFRQTAVFDICRGGLLTSSVSDIYQLMPSRIARINLRHVKTAPVDMGVGLHVCARVCHSEWKGQAYSH